MWVQSLVGKIPWRRKWQLTPVSLQRDFKQRNLAGYSRAAALDRTERVRGRSPWCSGVCFPASVSDTWHVALVLTGLFPRLCLGHVAGRLGAHGSVSLPLSRTHALTLLTHAGLSPGLWPIECETAHTASQQRFSVLPLSVFPRPENGRTGSGVPPLPESQKEETPHPGTDQQLRQYQLFFTLM